MKKLFLLLCIFMIAGIQAANAEKIPVKITPTQIISTHHDEIETGDYINFETVKDVYMNNKLYIRKNTPVIAFVDFFHPNGWVGDSAEIKINSFETLDANGKKVAINYPLDIDGNSLKANDVKQYLVRIAYVLIFVRGAEIYIEPDTKVFNIFIERL